MKTVLALVLVVFSILGVADASYLSWEKLSGTVPPCTASFKCDVVLSSEWSSVGVIPLSVFGILFYLTMLVVSSAWLLGKEQLLLGKYCLSLPKILALLGVAGLAFSVYLSFIMGVILGAWCIYCLISALNCVLLFFTTGLIYLKYNQKICSR